MKHLRQKENWGNLDENEGWLHNLINKKLYEKGFGIGQVEELIQDIRMAIQTYFSTFNPLPRKQR
jgi:hypothetical protein